MSRSACLSFLSRRTAGGPLPSLPLRCLLVPSMLQRTVVLCLTCCGLGATLWSPQYTHDAHLADSATLRSITWGTSCKRSAPLRVSLSHLVRTFQLQLCRLRRPQHYGMCLLHLVRGSTTNVRSSSSDVTLVPMIALRTVIFHRRPVE